MILRDYQEDIKGRVYAAWETGCRSVMCQMPTGTGKTVVLAQIIKEQTLRPSQSLRDSSPSMGSGWRDERSCRVLVVAHRKEILEQIRETLLRYGLEDGLEDGSIVVESIQKIARAGVRTKAMKDPSVMAGSANLALYEDKQGLTNKKNISTLSIEGEVAQNVPERVSSEGLLVIIDEAHHCTAKTYRKLWKWFPEAKFLGMTATPCRMKEEGFDTLFDKLICADDVPVFIKNGWLSMYEYYAAKPNSDMIYNVRTLRERGIDGDYKIGEMGNVMDNRASIEQLYKAYKDYAKGMQGIIYAINREHARHIAEYYTLALRANAQNLPAGRPSGTVADDSTGELLSTVAVVDSETPKEERERINKEYREGTIRILVNCEIYGEGYDAPFVQFIQLARPTLSLSKYLQQVGRGMRPHKDKKATVILDCVGNCYRFGMPNDVRDWQKMFHGGQIEGTHGSCVYIDSKDFRYMAMQARDILDVDDGHDHEMQQIVSFRDLERDIEKTLSAAQGGTSPSMGRKNSAKANKAISKKKKEKEIEKATSPVIFGKDETIVTITNDLTGEKETLTLPKGVASDYLAEAWRVSEAANSTHIFMKDGFYGLRRDGKVVLSAEYRNIILQSDDYAYVTGKNYANVLVNMSNEVVYGKGQVVALYEDDIICVDIETRRHQSDMRYVYLRDKNQYHFESIPLRRKVGKLDFLEAPGGIYRYLDNTKLPFLKTDLQFDEHGVLRVDALVKSATGKTSTLIAFEDDDFAYSLQGTHRDGDLVLMRFGNKKLYRWNGKDKPTEWNVNQRDLMMQMKRV